jgi:thymidylate synthase (FAD)
MSVQSLKADPDNTVQEHDPSLVVAPSVNVVAVSRMDVEGLTEFIKSEDLEPILQRETAPLRRILDAVTANAEMNGLELGAYSDAELLPEFAGRFCYRSWLKGRTTDEYHENIMEERHGSILEHTNLTLAITGVSRALTHELIRHRAGFAVSQESQRYVDAKDIRFVYPPIMIHYYGIDRADADEWLAQQMACVADYEKHQALLRMMIDEDPNLDDDGKSTKKKRANEAARASLPNACETRLVWTGNLRAMRHFLLTRGADPADLEIRRLAVEVFRAVKGVAPTIFADMTEVEGDFGVPCVVGKHWKV